MVLILDDNSEIGVHLRSNLCYLISVRHWIKSRAVTKVGYFFSLRKSNPKSYYPIYSPCIKQRAQNCKSSTL